MFKIVKIEKKKFHYLYNDAKYLAEIILKKKLNKLDDLFNHITNRKSSRRILFEVLNMLPSLQRIQYDFKKYLPIKFRKKAITWTYPQIRIDGRFNKQFSAPLHKDEWILDKSKKGLIIWFPINKKGASLYFSNSKKLNKFSKHSYWGIQSKDKIKLKKIHVKFGYAIIFDHTTVHKSVENENRISVQLRYEYLKIKNFKKTVNQQVDKSVKDFWLKKLKLKIK